MAYQNPSKGESDPSYDFDAVDIYLIKITIGHIEQSKDITLV